MDVISATCLRCQLFLIYAPFRLAHTMGDERLSSLPCMSLFKEIGLHRAKEVL
jgi:hypothetical protein